MEQLEPGPGLEHRDQLPQLVGAPDVVLIAQCDQVGAGIDRCGETVREVRHDAARSRVGRDEGVAVEPGESGAGDRDGVVRGLVIRDDDEIRLPTLRQDARELLPEVRGAVVGAHHHGDRRHGCAVSA